jgi:hypothetical protein
VIYHFRCHPGKGFLADFAVHWLSLLPSIHAAHEDDDDDSNGATEVTILLEAGVGKYDDVMELRVM